MGFNLRKFYIWLISLGMVLVVYLLYNRIGTAPQIDLTRDAEVTDTVSESNVGESGGEIGTIGEVRVETARDTEFITRNKKTKEVEAIFGFEELLHEEGDEWELEKPYMKFFRRNGDCYITADKGRVQVENAPSGPTPKDGKLTGNVVVHILPKNSSDIQESFVYLDDLVFISERSQFSTAGPVKFVSEGAQMLGRRLEGVYNSEVYRLESLRIFHLASFHLRTSRAALFGPARTNAGKPADTGSSTQTQRLGKSPRAGAGNSQRQKTSPVASTQPAEQEQGEYYKCIFSKNVVVDAPEQLILADDEISINNIFWPRNSDEKSSKADAGGADGAKTPAKLMSESVGSVENNAAVSADETRVPGEPVEEHSEPNESSEELVDVVITCDNGILLAPVDSSRSIEDFARPRPEPASSRTNVPGNLEDASERTTLVAKKVDYCASTDETVVDGPLELTFYPNDVMLTGAKRAEAGTVPVRVTARKEARFLPASNQIIFEGNCQCTMLQEDPNSQQDCSLSAPTLTVDVSKDRPEQSSDSALDIEHLTASGGVVRLVTIKTAEEKRLGVTELKCRQFDFDAVGRMFLATGPGVIKVDNSNVQDSNKSDPNSQGGGFSLRKPCWVFVRDFDTLKYFLDANQVVADAQPQGTLRIDYFPIIDANVQYDRQAVVTAGHIEALLHEVAPNEFELSTLNATGTVTYKDDDKQFEGSRLFYDADKSLMTVEGDQGQPCFLNGVPVDAIEWDLNTDKLKFEISGPGAL